MTAPECKQVKISLINCLISIPRTALHNFSDPNFLCPFNRTLSSSKVHEIDAEAISSINTATMLNRRTYSILPPSIFPLVKLLSQEDKPR